MGIYLHDSFFESQKLFWLDLLEKEVVILGISDKCYRYIITFKFNAHHVLQTPTLIFAVEKRYKLFEEE